MACCGSSWLEISFARVAAAAALTRRKAIDKRATLPDSRGRKRVGPEKSHAMPIHSGDDRRRLVPLALVQVLTCLIDETSELPNPLRAELRGIRTRLCRVYGVPDPQGRANASQVAQDLAEEDGDALQGY